VLGEIQLKQATSTLSSADQQAIVRKIIKSNQDTIKNLESENRISDIPILQKEIEILKSILPQAWDDGKIHQFIKDQNLDVLSAKNEGQAVGVVMKALKSNPDAVIDPAVVRAIVIELRS
jgi:uncharacterized protein YqeY